MGTIGEYVDFQNGYAFKSGDFRLDGEYKVVKIKELKDGKIRFTQNSACVEYIEGIEKYEINDGDVLFALTGDPISKPNPLSWVGRVSLYHGTEKAVINQRVCKIIPKEGLNPLYLYYFFRNNVEFFKLAGKATGSASQANISTKTIADTYIDLPSFEYQTKITSILHLLDEKIEINNEINDNLLQQAIALYEYLLKENEWPIATILDVAEKVAMGPFGSNIKVSTFVPEGVPIISGNHLRGYFLEEPEFNYITEEHAERLKNSIVFPHDLIFTHAGNIGQVAMIPDGCKYDRYVLSQRQFYLRCDETKVVPEFLLMFFHSASGQHELLSYANQTGVPSIAQPASNLKKIPFKCPPMQEQLKWQEQVHPLLGRYLNNRHENERLSSLRDALLPKLMSGELDVSELDL